MPKERFVIDDQIWDELIELTDGAAAVCFQCGVCTATCPWSLVRKDTLSVRSYIRRAQLGLQNGDQSLWLCTTCGQCEAYCPRGVNVADVFRGLRYLAWERNNPHQGLPSLLWSIYWNNNPWEQPPSQRMGWAKNIDLPQFDPDLHEILYYVGCTPSYDTRAQNIAHALLRLFNAAGIAFGMLGESEPCSGEEILSVGHKPYFKEVAETAKRVFEESGVTKLVTTDPHSYDVFRNHYQSLEQNQISPFHYTQYLNQLLDSKRLVFRKPFERKVTFHDPCYLSRHNHEIDSPRQVLAAIPGLQFVEMDKVGSDTLCCGGGGGRMWLETKAGERFSDLRVEEALVSGAQVIATACPYCIACLEDSVKAGGHKDLVIMDIAEIAASAI